MTLMSADHARAIVDWRGHHVIDDSPGPPSSVVRLTCTVCGRAALRYQRNHYGTALTEQCDRLAKSTGPSGCICGTIIKTHADGTQEFDGDCRSYGCDPACPFCSLPPDKEDFT